MNGLFINPSLILPPSQHIMGQGNVTIVSRDKETVFRTGQEFGLDELGPFQPLADLKMGITPEVWNRALAAHKELQQRATPSPPREVIDLLDKRNAVRKKKDWDSADMLRDKIKTPGWQVRDTPDGSQLKRL